MRALRGAARSLLAAAAFILVLAVGDLCIGALCPPKERLEKILEIFEIHPTRLWALKKSMAVSFQGAALTTDAEGHRVAAPGGGRGKGPLLYCMGDSLTFGWGVADGEAYPSLLAQGADPVRVTNLAVPGYTTWQGLRVLEEEVLPMAPRLVTISYGVNDVSKFRFFSSDLKTDGSQRAQSPSLVAIENFLMRTNFFCFFRNLNFKRREGSLDDQGRIMRLSDQATQRVLPEEYAAHLARLAERLTARGIAVVFVKMPLNLPRGPVVSAERRALAASHLVRAREQVRAGRPGEAFGEYLKSLQADPLDRRSCWEAYELCSSRGDDRGRAQVLNYLRKQEVYASSNLHVAYNALMDRTASAAGVPVVDVEAAFAAEKGRALFVDPVSDPYHPNAEGHRVIAQAIRSTGAYAALLDSRKALRR